MKDPRQPSENGFGGLSVFTTDVQATKSAVVDAMARLGFERVAWTHETYADVFQTLAGRVTDHVLVEAIPETKFVAVANNRWCFEPADHMLAISLSRTFPVVYIASLTERQFFAVFEDGQFFQGDGSSNANDFSWFTEHGALDSAESLRELFTTDVVTFGALTGCEGRSLDFYFEGATFDDFDPDSLLLFASAPK